MARKRLYVSRTVLPRAADDFTCIDGIGPVAQKRLRSAGIRTFGQLAALSADDIVSLIPNLSKKQITHQHWIEQASSIAGSKAREEDPMISASRQHYENFTLEFLLSEKNKVRRLQIVHIQSGDVDTWIKWDAERLIDFLARHTGVRLPATKGIVRAVSKRSFKPPASVEQLSETMTGADSIPSISQTEKNIDSTAFPAAVEATAPGPSPADRPPSTGTLHRIRLLEWKTLLSNTEQLLHNLSHDQCFEVRLMLDLSCASLPDTSQLEFTVILYARKLGKGPQKMIGEMQSSIPYASIVNLTISSSTLSSGLYRLEAFVTLVPTDASISQRSDIHSSFQGGLLQVY